MSEVWKDIPDYEGSYQVSNMGRVRSVDRVVTYKDGRMGKFKGKALKPYLGKGYERVMLCNDNGLTNKAVHRLVLEAFKPHVNMNDLQVNHIDGDKLNNHLTNLEWVTARDNMLHAYDIGLMTNKGERNPNAKLSSTDVLEILQRLDTGDSYKDIGSEYGVSGECISHIDAGITWRSVREEHERTKQTIPR